MCRCSVSGFSVRFGDLLANYLADKVGLITKVERISDFGEAIVLAVVHSPECLIEFVCHPVLRILAHARVVVRKARKVPRESLKISANHG